MKAKDSVRTTIALTLDGERYLILYWKDCCVPLEACLLSSERASWEIPWEYLIRNRKRWKNVRIQIKNVAPLPQKRR